MYGILVNHFNQLKHEISRISGIPRVMSADCRRLSVEIRKTTHKQISETTLKRIYGFASTRFNPSSFTLNTLSEYCGHGSWDDFLSVASDEAPEKPGEDWTRLADEATRITNYTLHVLKNRSGIPFRQTIPRGFLTDHLSIFINENYRGTVITAPSGYGKTVALCHWVDDFLGQNSQKPGKDILLLLSGSALFSGVNGFYEMSEWITAFPGVPSGNVHRKLPKFLESYTGRFFLVIDGLDNHFSHAQFHALLNQLHELSICYRNNDRVKIIVTMRTVTWNAVRGTLTEANNWFKGCMTGPANERNVPLLDAREIRQITGHTDLPGIPEHLRTLEVLCYPLYLQYVYDRPSGAFLPGKINALSMYELISTHVYHKIYLSGNSNEMMLLMDELIARMDLTGGIREVDKRAVSAVLKKYNKGYHELLDIGFISEHNQSSPFQYTVNLAFAEPAFLALAVAKRMLFLNKERFDDQLVPMLNADLAPALKQEVIKWCMYLTVGNRHPVPVRLLAEFALDFQQKRDLAAFLNRLLTRQPEHYL